MESSSSEGETIGLTDQANPGKVVRVLGGKAAGWGRGVAVKRCCHSRLDAVWSGGWVVEAEEGEGRGKRRNITIRNLWDQLEAQASAGVSCQDQVHEERDANSKNGTGEQRSAASWWQCN